MTNFWKAKIYQMYSFLLWITPLAILLGVNFNEYFVREGFSIGFVGYIVLLFAIIALKSKFTTFMKNNTILTFSIAMFAISLIMRYLADEILLISTLSLVGAIMSSIVEPVVTVYNSLAYVGSGEDRHRINTRAIPDREAWKRAYCFVAEDDNE